MELFSKPPGVQTRWASFENPTASRAAGARANRGSKGHAFDRLGAGDTHRLLDVTGSGTVRRIWLTVSDRSPRMLRGLRLDMWWDDAKEPAVSVPFGDFFGVGLGRTAAFSCGLFSDPEARSFASFIPMPFRQRARISLTNESGADLSHVFYDVDLTLGDRHGSDVLYLHSGWRRERLNRLGSDFEILPRVNGPGRFLGSNIGLIENRAYDRLWWGEGEVKVWFGDDELPTLCGTGLEDYLGAGWGLGVFAHDEQGCPIADGERGQWGFYRYHVRDPIWFDDGCRVAVQTIGGGPRQKVRELGARGVALEPVSIDPGGMAPFVGLVDRGTSDLADPNLPEGWCNFWRQDDWSATAYVYLSSPGRALPALAPAAERIADLEAVGDTSARADG